MYGAGVDQVLHLEMVLPDGRFVRFGPSAWDAPQDDQLYPQTTEVTGFCNTGDLSDESKWSWSECSDPIAFDDLWYAVRGGGGGNFGVVTSVYYQLHDKPGSLQMVQVPVPVSLCPGRARRPRQHEQFLQPAGRTRRDVLLLGRWAGLGRQVGGVQQ